MLTHQSPLVNTKIRLESGFSGDKSLILLLGFGNVWLSVISGLYRLIRKRLYRLFPNIVVLGRFNTGNGGAKIFQ
jgi:hypothetical protein